MSNGNQKPVESKLDKISLEIKKKQVQKASAISVFPEAAKAGQFHHRTIGDFKKQESCSTKVYWKYQKKRGNLKINGNNKDT